MSSVILDIAGKPHRVHATPGDIASLRALLADLEAEVGRKAAAQPPEGVPNRSKLEMWASAAAQAFSAPYTVVETIGALFGMAGAILLAMPVLPGWGFGAFLVSNLCWLSFSSGHRHWRMFVQQLVFLFSSLLGLWNWWLGPLLLG